MADLYLRLKHRVEVMIMKYKLVHTRLQAVGTPGEGKSFLSGAQHFLIMSNSFKLCPTYFFRGA